MAIDFTAHGRRPDPSKATCDMCGYKRKPLVTVFNPNVFPGNDDDNPEHFWDVCRACKQFIEQSVVRSCTAKMLIEMGLNADAATDAVMGMTGARESKCAECGSVRRRKGGRKSLTGDGRECPGCKSWLRGRRKRRKAAPRKA